MTTLVLLALAILLAWTAADRGCVTSSTAEGVDLFPDKVQPLESEYWTVEYGSTYKIVSSLSVNETYLLYQCGTEPPAAELDKDHAAVISIPLDVVGITSTTNIAFLQQLGLIHRISVFVSNPDTIASPCFKDRVEAGEVLVIGPDSGMDGGSDNLPAFGIGGKEQGQKDPLEVLSNTVAFTSPWDEDLPWKAGVQATAYLERTNAATFEWLKFYSTFFNLEALANKVVDLADDRFDCIAEDAAQLTSDSPQPPVLWAYYSGFCLGWDAGTCPNYYCEFAQACSAELITSDVGSITACGGNTYMTIEEIVELGKDAEYWIYPAPNWDTVYAENKELLDQMKSVQNQQVYDYQGSGEDGWFEQRLANYYEVLEDFCGIVGTTMNVRERLYFRNVFTEQVAAQSECIDPTEPLIMNEDHFCTPADADTMDESDDVQQPAQTDSTVTGTSSAATIHSTTSLRAKLLIGITLSAFMLI